MGNYKYIWRVGLREVLQSDVMPQKANRSFRLETYVVPVISNISNEHVEASRTISRTCVICGFPTFVELRMSSK